MTSQREAGHTLGLKDDRLRRTLDLAQRAVLLVGVDGSLLTFNDALCETLGYTRREIQALGAHAILPGADLARITREGCPQSRHRGRLRRRDGRSLDMEFTLSAFPEEGEPVGTMVELRDLAESQRLTDQLLLVERNEAIGAVVAGVAHDFNNALTIIGASIEAATQTHERRDELLQKAQLATDHAAAIVDQLLRLSRRATPVRELIDLADLAADTVALARDAIDRRIDLTVETCADPLFVTADGGQLRQVLLNLLLNAGDAVATRLEHEDGAAPAHGQYLPRIAVKVGLDGERGTGAAGDGVATVTVEDNGAGMPAIVRDRIFEPFFTTKEAGKGTGLGLSAVHAIVAEHGGACSVSSEAGHGSTFEVTLPLADAPGGAGIDGGRAGSRVRPGA